MRLPCIVKVTVTDSQPNHYSQWLESATNQIFEQFGWLSMLRQQGCVFKSELSELVRNSFVGTHTTEILEIVVSMAEVRADFLELRYVVFHQHQNQACAEFKARIFCYDTHVQQIDWSEALKHEFDSAHFEQNWAED